MRLTWACMPPMQKVHNRGIHTRRIFLTMGMRIIFELRDPFLTDLHEIDKNEGNV
jgi:hypothetical protein